MVLDGELQVAGGEYELVWDAEAAAEVLRFRQPAQEVRLQAPASTLVLSLSLKEGT